MYNKIWFLLGDVISEYNEGVSDKDKIIFHEDTELFGTTSSVDSMSLVNIVLNFEEKLSDEFNKDISLSDDTALNQKVSPYSTIGSFFDYANDLLKENIS